MELELTKQKGKRKERECLALGSESPLSYKLTARSFVTLLLTLWLGRKCPLPYTSSVCSLFLKILLVWTQTQHTHTICTHSFTIQKHDKTILHVCRSEKLFGCVRLRVANPVLHVTDLARPSIEQRNTKGKNACTLLCNMAKKALQQLLKLHPKVS